MLANSVGTQRLAPWNIGQALPGVSSLWLSIWLTILLLLVVAQAVTMAAAAALEVINHYKILWRQQALHIRLLLAQAVLVHLLLLDMAAMETTQYLRHLVLLQHP